MQADAHHGGGKQLSSTAFWTFLFWKASQPSLAGSHVLTLGLGLASPWFLLQAFAAREHLRFLSRSTPSVSFDTLLHGPCPSQPNLPSQRPVCAVCLAWLDRPKARYSRDAPRHATMPDATKLPRLVILRHLPRCRKGCWASGDILPGGMPNEASMRQQASLRNSLILEVS